MKHISVILALAYLLAACSNQHTSPTTHGSDISVVHDLTDPFDLQPVAEPILALFDFETNKDQAAAFRFVLITDKQLNPVEEIHLDEGAVTEQRNLNDEIDYREQLIYSFYDAVQKSFTDFHTRYKHSSTLGNSECFATISSELNRLANGKASKRILIVFSDLQENEEAFNCYTEQGQYMLDTNPNQVAKILQKRSPLPADLQGITVYFVYNPMNKEQDKRFSEMIGIYKQLLKERHTRVVVQATQYYQP